MSHKKKKVREKGWLRNKRGGEVRKRKKKGELKPDTQELGPPASDFLD